MKRKFFVLFLSLLCVINFTACNHDSIKGVDDTPNSSTEHVHVLEIVTGIPATCTDGGIIDHYRCTRCEKLFSDNSGTTEITDLFIPALGHVGGTATCTEKAVCSRCHKQYGELGHLFGNYEQTQAPTCTQSGILTAVCSLCGSLKTENISALGHNGEWKVVAEPRCFDDGKKQRICTVCDALEEENIPAIGHELKDSTCVGGQQCIRCNYTKGIGRGHAYDDWKEITSANCVEDGEKERECLVCGYKETAKIPRTGHAGNWLTDTAPTCTESGKEYRYCSNCNQYDERVVNKTGHKGEWVEETSATCTVIGQKKRTCTVCGKIETAVILAAHNYTDYNEETPATCTITGIMRMRCDKCGDYKDRIIPKKYHSMDWNIIKEATCTENGLKVGTCSECEQVVNEAINKLGHDMHGGSCTIPSQCLRCGEIEYNSHTFEEAIVIIGPDCERFGWAQQTCSECGEVDIFRDESPTGHNLENWVLCEETTCIKEGRERSFCTKCHKACDKTLGMLPHIAGEMEVVKEPSCVAKGLKQSHCLGCGEVMGEEEIQPLGHDIITATCFEPNKCSRCDYTQGTALEHQLDETGCTICGFGYAEGMSFELSEDGNSYCLTSIVSASEKLLIPAIYNGKQVTVIAEQTFSDHGNIEEVSIPKSIETIQSNAFCGLWNLKAVYIEKGSCLKTIEDCAFAECHNLTSITLPNCVTSIGDYAFSICSGLTSITIPDSVTSIGVGALSRCSNLTSIVIPNNVTNVGDTLFEGCSSLKNVTIGSGVTYIGIGSLMFNNCFNLESITVSETNTAFSSQSGILYDKAKTQIIHVPSAIKGEVELPSSVIGIAYYAFDGCRNLESITVPNDNTAFSSQGGILYDKAKTQIIHVPSAIKGEVVISDNVWRIDENEFRDCNGIISITLSANVSMIRQYAFFGCSSLTSIIFNGTIVQWNAIDKSSYWDVGMEDYIIHCTDGDIVKS